MSQYDPRDRSMGKTRKLVSRLFPERHVMVRTDGKLKSVRLGSASQIVLTLCAMGVAGWVGYASYANINHQAIIASKQHDIEEARSAYKALVAQVAVYRDRISDVAEELERNHSHTMSLAERNSSLGQRLAEMESELADTEAARDQAEEQKQRLAGHLEKLKTELKTAAERGQSADGEATTAEATAPASAAQQVALAADDPLTVQLERERVAREREALRRELSRLEEQMTAAPDRTLYEGDLNAVEVELRKVVLQRDLAEAESTSLREQVETLQGRLASMEDTQLALFQRFGSLARDRITELRDAVEKTGLDVDALLEDATDGANQGGPFIPLDLGNWSDDQTLGRSLVSLNEKVAEWSTLQNTLELLPLGKPMRQWTVTSYFGPRKDPMTGSVAVHQGLDMAAPYKSPVMATGVGKVVYAGWRGRYGRLVEIDHGNGVKTRYGHLNKIFVKRGDLVDRSTKLGLMGSSGRSTGPHLHYEVLVNGKPRNPDKFIKAGANVFQG